MEGNRGSHVLPLGEGEDRPYELPSIQELGDLSELTEVSVSIMIP